MLRPLLSMFFWVVVARWGYAEIKLNLPGLVPFIDHSLQQIQIPTHDKWPSQAELLGAAQNVMAAIQNKPVNEGAKQFSFNQSDFFGTMLLTENSSKKADSERF